MKILPIAAINEHVQLAPIPGFIKVLLKDCFCKFLPDLNKGLEIKVEDM